MHGSTVCFVTVLCYHILGLELTQLRSILQLHSAGCAAGMLFPFTPVTPNHSNNMASSTNSLTWQQHIWQPICCRFNLSSSHNHSLYVTVLHPPLDRALRARFIENFKIEIYFIKPYVNMKFNFFVAANSSINFQKLLFALIVRYSISGTFHKNMKEICRTFVHV